MTQTHSPPGATEYVKRNCTRIRGPVVKTDARAGEGTVIASRSSDDDLMRGCRPAQCIDDRLTGVGEPIREEDGGRMCLAVPSCIVAVLSKVTCEDFAGLSAVSPNVHRDGRLRFRSAQHGNNKPLIYLSFVRELSGSGAERHGKRELAGGEV